MESQKSIVTEDMVNEKTKVTKAYIIIEGTVEKPYYEIKYLVIGEDEYRIGYSSYDLKNVFGWLEECFEVVDQSILNSMQRRNG